MAMRRYDRRSEKFDPPPITPYNVHTDEMKDFSHEDGT